MSAATGSAGPGLLADITVRWQSADGLLPTPAVAEPEGGCESADAVGALATLLHYEQTNPLSAPFWARHGYRPLWTSWEARPACTMR